jgi:surface protein
MNCRSLTSLDLSNLESSKVEYISQTFSGCSSLRTISLPRLSGNLKQMPDLFADCINLQSVDFSRFDTSNVDTMSRLFYNCTRLTSIRLPVNTENLISMNSLFDGCSSLTSIDLSSFTTKSVTTMNSLFKGCSSLSFLDISKFESGNCKDFQNMFGGCNKLTVKMNKDKNSEIFNLLPAGSEISP